MADSSLTHMMRKIILSALLLTTLSGTLKAQFPSLGLPKKNDPVSQCLERGIAFVKQAYVLEDSSGNQFGSDGKEYFFMKYYVAAEVKGGYMLPPEFFAQKKTDTLVNDIRYKIKPGKIFVADPGKNTWRELNGKADAAKMLIPDASVTEFHKQLAVKSGTGFKLIVYYAPKDVAEPELLQIKRSTETLDSLSFDENGLAKINKQISFDQSRIIGGYVFKETITTGMIDYALVGIYSYNGKEWYIKKTANTVELSPVQQKTHKHHSETQNSGRNDL